MLWLVDYIDQVSVAATQDVIIKVLDTLCAVAINVLDRLYPAEGECVGSNPEDWLISVSFVEIFGA